MNLIIVDAYFELRRDGDTYFKCPFCRHPDSSRAKFHSVDRNIKGRNEPLQTLNGRHYIDLVGEDVPCETPGIFAPFSGFRVMLL